MAMTDRVVITNVTRVTADGPTVDQDLVAAEAPLEILLTHSATSAQHSIGLVMRTPGDDEDLVAGLLVSEQIVSQPDDIVAMSFVAETGPDVEGASAHPARALVTLAATIDLGSVAATRVLAGTSACGMIWRRLARSPSSKNSF